MYHWFITYSLCFLLYFFDLTAILLTFRIFRDVARIGCGGYLEGGWAGFAWVDFYHILASILFWLRVQLEHHSGLFFLSFGMKEFFIFRFEAGCSCKSLIFPCRYVHGLCFYFILKF